jgi:hypothetical protein
MSGAQPQSPILQNCSTLREKVRKVKSHGGSEQTVRTWRPIQDSLPSHLERMQKLVAVLRILHRRRMLPAGQSPVPTKLRSLFDSLESLRDKLLNKPDRVMERNTWADCNNNLRGSATSLEANLKAIWSEYITLLTPKIDHLKPFLNLSRCGAEIRKITGLQGELKELEDSLPTEEEALRRAEEKSREIQKRVAKLDFGDVPPEVKRFIERVNSLGGATLADLTEEILVWLREKSLLESFRIR